jgi:hypothetical protein
MLNSQTPTYPMIPTGPRRQGDQIVTHLTITSGWLFTGPP